MKVFLIGAGQVANAIGKNLLKAGHTITGVYSRSNSAEILATRLSVRPYHDLKTIPNDSDIYLICISDDSIEVLANKLKPLKGMVAHTSGSTPMSVLNKHKLHGVFYPVDTITGRRPNSFLKVPICIEASGEKAKSKLMLLAASISDRIYILDSRQRAILHVAAVFANNFTNYLLGVAIDLIRTGDLPSELLESLAKSTVTNAFTYGAMEAQTGPARRGDMKTINRHLKILKKNPEYYELYRVLTDLIGKVHKNPVTKK